MENGAFSERTVRTATPFLQGRPFTAENFRIGGQRKRKNASFPQNP
jgi:hypothetical protein